MKEKERPLKNFTYIAKDGKTFYADDAEDLAIKFNMLHMIARNYMDIERRKELGTGKLSPEELEVDKKSYANQFREIWYDITNPYKEYYPRDFIQKGRQ